MHITCSQSTEYSQQRMPLVVLTPLKNEGAKACCFIPFQQLELFQCQNCTAKEKMANSFYATNQQNQVSHHRHDPDLHQQGKTPPAHGWWHSGSRRWHGGATYALKGEALWCGCSWWWKGFELLLVAVALCSRCDTVATELLCSF